MSAFFIYISQLIYDKKYFYSDADEIEKRITRIQAQWGRQLARCVDAFTMVKNICTFGIQIESATIDGRNLSIYSTE